jgi:Ca-activated chloride channel family protein
LVQEVVALAKKYGITTPYTSYLIVPDGPMPVVNRAAGGERPNVGFGLGGMPGSPPPALAGRSGSGGGAAGPRSVDDFAREVKNAPDGAGSKRGHLAEDELRKAADGKGKDKEGEKVLREALELKTASDATYARLRSGDMNAVQAGKLGVDLSVYSGYLRGQTRMARTAVRQVWGRNCMEIGGVWIDEGFTAKAPTLIVKAQSDAYFKLLERQPKLKEVFKLGNYLVWVAPSGTALVIDTSTKAKDKLSDAEIDKLFVAKK